MNKQQRYGFAAPVKVIAAMFKTPRTLDRIAIVTGLSDHTARNILAAIRDMDRAHVKAWQVRPGKVAARMYLFGQGEDAPFSGKPRRESKPDRVEFCTRIVIKFIDAISEDASTRGQICAKTELSPISCTKIVRLLKEHGLIHIAGYCRKGHDGQWAAQFMFGPGVDAEKPKAISSAQKLKNYRDSRRALSSDGFLVALRQIEAANEERRAA
jgi:hypothetical protein